MVESSQTRMIEIHSKSEIEKMRAAGRLAAQILIETGSRVKSGVSTGELNDYALELATKAGAIMAPYKYKASPTDTPFPKHICTSINNVVCHGIPKSKEHLRKGDIINIDVTVILNGYHGDTSRTFIVEKCSENAQKLVDITEKALHEGIKAANPGECISGIGLAIENFVKPHNYGIVEALTGHGVGKKFHMDPSIFHFYNPKYKLKLKPGMIFTIEPMLNRGSKEVRLLDDGWTIVTADGNLSAQFEHTILVTETGHEILTNP